MERWLLIAIVLSACFSLPAGQAIHAQARGPLLAVTPDPLDFDTVFCGTSRCMDVTLRNAGDTALTVQSFDALTSPFEGGVSTPLTLAPGETQRVQWCYAPTRVMTRDSISVRFISDNRISYSFGFLVDVSTAMAAALPDAADAIGAARSELSAFVQYMMANGSPQHEGAVFAYSASSEFRLLRGLSEERALIAGALPGTATGPHACVWQGMDRAISLMAAAKHRQVLIVINGSEDAGVGSCGPYSAPGVASAALAADMIVCAVSFGGASAASLADIAAQTGGLHRSVTSAAELGQALHDIILHLQRAVAQELTVRGEVVSPALALSRDAVRFPTTRDGDTAHVTAMLRNVGTAPMDIGSIAGETPTFGVSIAPRQLPPGDSLALDLSYHPAAQGYAFTSVTAAINGCVPGMPALRLHGLCYEDVNPTLGPVLANAPRDIDAGRIPCDTGGELIVPVRNAGDAVLDVFWPIVQAARVPPPDKGSWAVGAGSETPITLRLEAGGLPGPDSCVFLFSARTRRTANTVVLIDASSTLRPSWQGLDGSAMARLLIGRLAAGMSATSEIDDRLAVLEAGRTGVSTLHDFTVDRDLLAALSPGPGSSDTTSLLAGIDQSVDLLLQRDGVRRLLIFTAGSSDLSELTGTPEVATVARKAAGNDLQIRVLAIDQHPLSDSLRAFVDAAGGTLTDITDPGQLDGAIASIEADAVDTVRVSRVIRWVTISSDPAVTPAEAVIPESHVTEAACADFTVTNTGESLLRITDVSSVATGFGVATALPLEVPAGGSATLRLCYTPGALGAWSCDAEIRGNSCLHPSVSVRLSGEATDSNTVRIEGDEAVRPGAFVVLPVLLDHALPQEYDVRRMTLRVSYDPSLLYPDMDRPLVNAPGGAVGYDVAVTQEYDQESGQAVSSYDITARSGGVPLFSPGPPEPLFSLRLRAFLGRQLHTDVRLQSAAFPGHPVALGWSGSARVRLDSMLWLEDRLIDASALWGTLGKSAPHPLRGRGRIEYTIHEEGRIRLALYDLHGKLQRVLHEGEAKAGSFSASVDAAGLSPGAYVCRLESARGTLSRMILISSMEEAR